MPTKSKKIKKKNPPRGKVREIKAVKAWMGVLNGQLDRKPHNWEGAWDLKGVSVFHRRSDAAQLYERVIPVLISPISPKRSKGASR